MPSAGLDRSAPLAGGNRTRPFGGGRRAGDQESARSDRVQSSVRRATRLERIAVDVSPGPPSPIAIRTARREIDPHAVRASRKQKAQARQNHIYCAALNLRNRSAHSIDCESSRDDGSRSGPGGGYRLY